MSADQTRAARPSSGASGAPATETAPGSVAASSPTLPSAGEEATTVPWWELPSWPLRHTEHSPMTASEAAWVLTEILVPASYTRHWGVSIPSIAGQRTCLHLPATECHSCRLGYHCCTGRSWGALPACVIRDQKYLTYLGDWRQQVWIAPIPCRCVCPGPLPPLGQLDLLDSFGAIA